MKYKQPLQIAGIYLSPSIFEGSSNNKALEIYNGTGGSIDLGAEGYSIEMYFNASTSPGTTIALSGSVANGDVYIVADDDAYSTILAQADQTSTSSFFNGNDAIVLKHNGTIIDVIGQVGTDPGSEWGAGDASTQNNTLRRQNTIGAGDTDDSDAFDPSTEWDGYAQDTFDGLGAHTTTGCGDSGASNWIINEVQADPDSTNGDANGDGIVSSTQDEFVEIYNNTGGNVDISGWFLSDGFGLRHTFPSGSVVMNQCSVVVFGGGTPTGTFGNSLVQTASYDTLGFNNSGDTITLSNSGGNLISVTYGSEGGNNQSLTRDPDITGTFGEHSTATGSSGALFSPGTLINGSHFSGCGDAAPIVSSTTPTNNTIGVVVDSNIVINFSENVDIIGTWYNIGCTSSSTHTAAVTGGPQSFILNPDTNFAINETCTVTIYAAQITDQDTDDGPDVMETNHVFSFATEESPAPCTTIPSIQGTGNASTCQGHQDNIQGCITGVTAKGFYFQDMSGDGNSASSDGIFAYFWSTWTNPNNLQTGDLVSVSGNVTEYYDTTEFAHSSSDNLSVSVIGSCTVPPPARVPPNLDPTTNPMSLYERYEGMRVQMTFDGWVVGPTKRFDSRFHYGDPEIAFADFGSTIRDYERVFQSDYPGYQGINYLSGGLDFDLPELDFGDDIAGAKVTGVLGYQFDKYTLLVDAAPTLTTVDNPSTAIPKIAADSAKLEYDFCYYNVENLFDNLDDSSGDWGDWAPGWPNPGTPEGAAEYQAHLIENVAVMFNDAKSCLVIGLSEVEVKQSIYDDLATNLSTLDAAHNWTGIYVESGDSRDITQGFLYRDDVTLLSGPTSVNSTPYTDWVGDSTLDFRRVPAAATFRFFAGTNVEVDITAYAVHFKSKRASTSCASDDCTDIRELEAADLRDIMGHHEGAGEYAIAGGNFNDYITSSPINILTTSTSIYNLFADLPANEQYSFIFSGESEVLDYIFVTQNMLFENDFMWGHTFNSIHVNADFPASEHASDHDPVRVRFLGSDLSDLAASFGEAWHTIPHLITLGDSISNDADGTADGDNASDTGVSILSGTWAPGQTVTIQAQVSGGSGWLSGWFDWDLNGVFDDPGEKAINNAVELGNNIFDIIVPAGAQIGLGGIEDDYMSVRFRLYESATEPSAFVIAPMTAELAGGVSGGEVEDYVWGFTPNAITLQNFNVQTNQDDWMPAFVIITGFSALSLWGWRRSRKGKHTA